MPLPRKVLRRPKVFFSPWIFLTLLLWGSQPDARADAPTVPPACSLQKISKDVPYSYAMSADGSRFALGSLTSKEKKRARRPWTDPAHTEQFFLFDTQRQKRKKIAKHRFTGRARIPFIQTSADGTRTVFASVGNLTGENADGNSEIFLYNNADKALSQITGTTGSDHFAPAISADGMRIAFLANQKPTGGPGDSLTVLILLDLAAGSRTEIARTTPSSSISGVSLNGDGTTLAFAANLDLTGANGDGTTEIFLWAAAALGFTQLTDAVGNETNAGNSFSPAISADGTRVVFNSVANLTGENPGGNFELFLFDSRVGTVTQLTHTTGDSGLYTDSSVSADGTNIVFEGNKDLLTGNIDNVRDGNDSEIFLIDASTRALTQFTNSNGTSASPKISADGTHIAFISRRAILVGADLIGYNSVNQKPDPTAGIYLATCP
jgi:Tol biopolymer transport system component